MHLRDPRLRIEKIMKDLRLIGKCRLIKDRLEGLNSWNGRSGPLHIKVIGGREGFSAYEGMNTFTGQTLWWNSDLWQLYLKIQQMLHLEPVNADNSVVRALKCWISCQYTQLSHMKYDILLLPSIWAHESLLVRLVYLGALIKVTLVEPHSVQHDWNWTKAIW